MKYLFVISSLLLSLSAFSQVNTCSETGPGNSCSKTKLVCTGSYGDAKNGDQILKFSKELTHEFEEAIFISANSSVKSNDGLFEFTGYAAVYNKDFYWVGVIVTDLRTGMESSSDAESKEANLILNEGKAPNITKTLSLECNVE